MTTKQVGLIFSLLVALGLTAGLPASAAKVVFDLSKGPVRFGYICPGVYNPIEIIILGENATAQIELSTDHYTSYTELSAREELRLHERGAVTWLDLVVESLIGRLSFSAALSAGPRFQVELTGTGRSLLVELSTGEEKTPDQTVRALVQVAAESGKLIVLDGTPPPDSLDLIAQRYGIPAEELAQLREQFGAFQVAKAFQTAEGHHGSPLAVAGGAAGLGENGCVSIRDLPPAELFRISLAGLRYQGYLQDSTLYMRLFHPANGLSLCDARVTITVVELDPPAPLGGNHVVLWDVFPYDDLAQCYRYQFDASGWRPGAYRVYIDVGRLLSFSLPLTVTDWHQVVARRD